MDKQRAAGSSPAFLRGARARNLTSQKSLKHHLVFVLTVFRVSSLQQYVSLWSRNRRRSFLFLSLLSPPLFFFFFPVVLCGFASTCYLSFTLDLSLDTTRATNSVGRYLRKAFFSPIPFLAK